MKRIALVLSNTPHVGGEYQYALLIFEALKSNEKFEVQYICTNRHWYELCKNKGLKCKRLYLPVFNEEEYRDLCAHPCLMRYLYTHYSDWGKYLKKEKIDILFLTNQLVYMPDYNTKLIVPIHDLMHRYEGDFPEVKDGYKSREQIFSIQAKYADYVLTDSEMGKEQYLQSYGHIAKRKQMIESVPFVVPDYIFYARQEFIEVPDKYIFYPAQFWKHKNQINLIKAIEILKEDIPDIKLLLSGSDKNNGQYIRGYVKNHKLMDFVEILGYVSNEQMTYLYKHATAMFMPSFFGPTNIPPLEAMALGCPVAVSNKYAMPEQVGNAGLLFNPDSPDEIAVCIRKVWKDDKLRKKMIENGYHQINKWTRDDFMKRINEIVDRV